MRSHESCPVFQLDEIRETSLESMIKKNENKKGKLKNNDLEQKK